jgi:hypothetical protein
MTRIHLLDPHLPAGEVAIRLADAARDRQEQRQRVLGHRGGVGLRRVGDQHTLLCGRGDIDVVRPDPVLADDPELLARADDLGRQLGHPHQHRLHVGHGLGQRLLVGPRPGNGLQAGLLQRLPPDRMDVFRDQNPQLHVSLALS